MCLCIGIKVIVLCSVGFSFEGGTPTDISPPKFIAIFHSLKFNALLHMIHITCCIWSARRRQPSELCVN
jgi:hypothetical protein